MKVESKDGSTFLTIGKDVDVQSLDFTVPLQVDASDLEALGSWIADNKETIPNVSDLDDEVVPVGVDEKDQRFMDALSWNRDAIAKARRGRA